MYNKKKEHYVVCNGVLDIVEVLLIYSVFYYVFVLVLKNHFNDFWSILIPFIVGLAILVWRSYFSLSKMTLNSDEITLVYFFRIKKKIVKINLSNIRNVKWQASYVGKTLLSQVIFIEYEIFNKKNNRINLLINMYDVKKIKDFFLTNDIVIK